MAALQAATLACMWSLQRTALHTKRWRPVIASQLAGGALSKVAPAGGAVGAALQYRMLVEAGFDRGRVRGGHHRREPAHFRGGPDPAGARGARDRARRREPRPGRGDRGRPGGVRRDAGAGRARVRARRPAAVGGPDRSADPQPPAPGRAAAQRRCPTACCTSATASSPRSGRAGSARWPPPWDGGRSTTGSCSPRSRPWAPHRARRWCCSPSARRRCCPRCPPLRAGSGSSRPVSRPRSALAGVSAGDAVLATLAYRLFTYWAALPLGLAGARPPAQGQILRPVRVPAPLLSHRHAPLPPSGGG